jgi:hypothetical protein
MIRVGAVFGLLLAVGPATAAPEEAALRKAVMLYASFDEAVRADYGQGGALTLKTRSTDPERKDRWIISSGIPSKAFRIAPGKGISGGALECVDVLPNNGRIFFPARLNLAYKKGGWGGAVSVWVKTDPNKMLKTKFCDPIQISYRGAHDAGIWFDFNDAKPRDLRMGAFTALRAREKPIPESDPKAPLVRVEDIGWKADDWHHVVMSWRNFDTGKKDAVATLYIDGKKIGQIKDRAIAMDWNIWLTGIYVGVNFIGLLDELAVFGRDLTADEVTYLYKHPAALSPARKKASSP